MKTFLLTLLLILACNINCQNLNIKGLCSWENIVSETNRFISINPCFENTYVIENKIKTVETILYEYDSTGMEISRYSDGIISYDMNGLIISEINKCVDCKYDYDSKRCRYNIDCKNKCGIVEPKGEITSVRILEKKIQYDIDTQLLMEHILTYYNCEIKEVYEYNENLTIHIVKEYRNDILYLQKEFKYQYY